MPSDDARSSWKRRTRPAVTVSSAVTVKNSPVSGDTSALAAGGGYDAVARSTLAPADSEVSVPVRSGAPASPRLRTLTIRFAK